MDTLTHALSGALLARAAAPTDLSKVGSTGTQWLVAGACAAAFPDIDYLYYLIDPLDYLNVHQGLTHSLVLWPLWAAGLGLLFAIACGTRRCWMWLAGVCALGVGIHIAGDLLTTYGVQAFAPLSRDRISLRTTFVIDPYFSAVLFAACLTLGTRWARIAAFSALSLIVLYVAAQFALQRQALGLARTYAETTALADFRVHALPQPFHPFNWKLVVEQPDGFRETHVNLAAREPSSFVFPAHWTFGRVAAAYRPASALVWQHHARMDREGPASGEPVEVWQLPALAGFRRFAAFPVVHRDERRDDERCVWFTDLRYTWPELRPPFRYGACRAEPTSIWRAYRLRFFTATERQPLR